MTLQVVTYGQRHYRLPVVSPGLGVYIGQGTSAGDTATQALVASWGTTTDTNVALYQLYLPHQASGGWTYLTTESSLASYVATWVGMPQQAVVCVPMVCTVSGTPQNTLAQGAAGSIGSVGSVATVMGEIAANLVTLGFSNAIIRLGWEFNWGTTLGYPWAANTDADALNYASFFAQCVTAMRAAAGANFTFAWSIATATGITETWALEDAYPGDAYVDYVMTDVYDRTHSTIMFPSPPNNTCTVAQSNVLWNWFLTGNSFSGSAANFLPGTNSTFETGLGNWVTDAHCTIAQSSVESHSGTHSMAVTATGSSQFTAPQIKFVDGVVAGRTYTFSFYALAGSTGRAWTINVDWLDGNQTLISTSNITGVGTDNSSTWTLITGTATAPANTRKFTLYPSFIGSSPEIHYVDDVVIAGPIGSESSLNWLVSFAQIHQKRVGIPEWAVNNFADNSGLGDDPTFIQNMYAWMVANNVAISCYFSQIAIAPDNYNLIGGSFPNALAAFQAQNWSVA